MKILEQISTGLSISILVACCVAFLIFGISSTGWKALSIPTGSMRPTISSGSLVLVHRVSISSLKIGDVITYTNPLNPRTTLSHRIVKKYLVDNKVPAFITKGDANKTDDVPITEGSIQGKVVWHISDVGYWLLDAKKPIIILPIVYIASALIMAEEVMRLSEYYKLRQPYQISRFKKLGRSSSLMSSKIKIGITISGVFVFIGVILSSTPVEALLRSNVVSLSNNTLTVAAAKQCSGNTTNNTSINVSNNSSQSALSGNVSNSSGGTSISGNVSNNNSSNTNITITNC